MRIYSSTLLLVIVASSLYGQTGTINNTIGTGGSFVVKDGSSTFMSLSQSTGYLTLNKSLGLPVATDSTLGVIYKGAERFIHDYKGSGAAGFNTFVGGNSGNFTMTGNALLGSYNTSHGHSSLSSLTTGFYNSAFGFAALFLNAGGAHNSAFGVESLFYNTSGGSNSAFGYRSLFFNNTGSSNSAFGFQSLYNNTTGTYNSSLGLYSLYSNSSGYNNCAVGGFSMRNNTTGASNSALGHETLHSNIDGTNNSAFGYRSLYTNASGYQNSAFGYRSLYSTTGNNNTALGYSAGYNLTTGSNTMLLGYNAQPSGAIASDEITLGNNQIAALRCNVQMISTLSDARDKKDIKDLSLGVDFLMSVKPRQFNWDRREWYESGKADGSKMQEKPTAGFIAQELDKAQVSADAEWLNLVLKSNPDRLEATPGNLLPIMVKAIQELKVENDELKARLSVFENEMAQLKSGKSLGQAGIDK